MQEDISEPEVRQAGSALLEWLKSQGLEVHNAFTVTFQVAMYLATVALERCNAEQIAMLDEYMHSEVDRAIKTRMR